MLKTRIVTALVLAIGFLTALFNASNVVWAFITLAITLLGVWEWSKLIKLKKNQMLASIACALTIGLLLIFTSDASLTSMLPASSLFALYAESFVFTLLCVATVFWMILAPIWLISRKKLHQPLLMAVLGLSLLLATWLALNGLHNISPLLLLAVMATVWLADSAAYFAGRKYGKHKLAVEISPGKTWEGVAGAMLAVTLYGLLLCYYLHISRWLILGLWFIVVLSVMGDLFESLLKRQAGVKDSSHLLPGHGGILDRIDGLIPVLPLVLFYIQFPLFANVQLHA